MGGTKKALKNRLSRGPIVTFFTPVRPKRQKNRIFSVLQLGVALAMPYIPHAERHSTHHLDDHGEMYGEGAESSSKEEGRS